MFNHKPVKAFVAALLSLALIPSVAFASSPAGSVNESVSVEQVNPWYFDLNTIALNEDISGTVNNSDAAVQESASVVFGDVYDTLETEMERQFRLANKVLPYNPADIDTIGTQKSTGHTICCPSFSCAYADAVLDGTVRSHSYYHCYSCLWPDWGGGNSSFRNLGSSQALLREAYDQITAGKPTVIHVAASYGEHWIALIGYTNAVDPDNLSLSNFIALDPWDGTEINAGSRFRLYGDNCEHISSR